MHAPIFIAIIVVVEVALGLAPKADRLTWALENFPVWLGLVWIGFTFRRFPLSQLCLILLTVHSIILAVGGYYTYAQVPLGFWMQDWFGFERNHYDRIGHFVQGFAPAILVRELLIRRAKMPRTGWLPATTAMFCLGFSALFEVFEWLSVVVGGEAATDYLGMQGDIWDAQWDMLFCGVGAVVALLSLSRWHDRSLKAVAGTIPPAKSTSP
jgi:putative membrane protein